MSSLRDENLQNQVYLLRAENERLSQESKAFQRKNQILEQKVQALTSLLAMYQINELRADTAGDKVDKNMNQRKTLPSVDVLSHMTNKLIGKNETIDDGMTQSQMNSFLKMGEHIMVLQRQLDYLRLETNFMIQEMRSDFENTIIEFESKAQDYQAKAPSKSTDKKSVLNKAQNSRKKLEKLVDIFDNIA